LKHYASQRFWTCYHELPKPIQELADSKFEMLKENPRHPSLHLKKIGNKQSIWSVRVGLHYRALGKDKSYGIVWFWIGSHAQYDRLVT